MGGDAAALSQNSSTEDESSLLEREFGLQSFDSFTFLRDDPLITRADEGPEDGEFGPPPGEFGGVGHENPSSSVLQEASRRRARNIYAEVLQSYEELHRRSRSLEEIKKKVLSYTRRSWMENVGGIILDDYTQGSWMGAGIKFGVCDVPERTSLLLIGPKGSGKSSLINKISRMLEDDKFLPERAQVSCNSAAGEGTYFLQDYAIPRGSKSIFLYDTRSLSDDPSENEKMFKRWMTKGVRSGELDIRDSDSSALKTAKKYKAHQYAASGKVNKVNFVVMVVNGLSVLEAMDSADEGKKLYARRIATQFNHPFLSIKDDKPAVVLTHGDLLGHSDRARVRVYLGELLGIPCRTQIFDIADGDDPTTELSIADLLCYCLEHADKNLPLKSKRDSRKADRVFFLVIGILLILAILVHLTSAAPSISFAY